MEMLFWVLFNTINIVSHVLVGKQGSMYNGVSLPSLLREWQGFHYVVVDGVDESDKTQPGLWQTETALQ